MASNGHRDTHPLATVVTASARTPTVRHKAGEERRMRSCRLPSPWTTGIQGLAGIGRTGTRIVLPRAASVSESGDGTWSRVRGGAASIFVHAPAPRHGAQTESARMAAVQHRDLLRTCLLWQRIVMCRALEVEHFKCPWVFWSNTLCATSCMLNSRVQRTFHCRLGVCFVLGLSMARAHFDGFRVYLVVDAQP